MIKHLPELIRENVISQEIADRITDYYLSKKKQGSNKLFVIFGVLGALLVGLGIILIIAHNWDKLPRISKVIFAFLPLVIAQTLCGYTLIKKRGNLAWKESTSTFLVLSIGACISLISQVYHVSGNLSTFLLVWMSLCLPIQYLMNSSFASLLYILGITYYSCESGYFAYPTAEPYLYWLLLIVAIPYYVKLIKEHPESNFVRFHNVFIALSVIITLGTLAKDRYELMYISYFNLFGILLTLEAIPYLKKNKLQDKSFGIIGFTGTMVLLFITSFNWFWEHLYDRLHTMDQLFISQEIIPLLLTTLIAITVLFMKYSKEGLNQINPIELVFLFFILVFIIAGANATIAIVLINAVILCLGVTTMMAGLKGNHLGILNLGILIIAILIACRFFDTDLSFLTRGLLFVAVGAGFFLTNYRMLKNRRRNEN